jgi:hypothetical protein
MALPDDDAIDTAEGCRPQSVLVASDPVRVQHDVDTKDTAHVEPMDLTS